MSVVHIVLCLEASYHYEAREGYSSRVKGFYQIGCLSFSPALLRIFFKLFPHAAAKGASTLVTILMRIAYAIDPHFEMRIKCAFGSVHIAKSELSTFNAYVILYIT